MEIPALRINLAEPPRIAAIGIGTHGPSPRERWRLPGLWCVHAYDYDATLTLDGLALPIAPGSIGVCPAGADLIYAFPGRSTHSFSHFRPAAGPARWTVPAMTRAGAGWRAFDQGLREAVAWWPTEPRRAEARLWDLLWRLATPAGEVAHPLVERARRLIELRLGEPLPVSRVARELGCSHNHLIRLFRAELGTTPAAWIRARRAARARHLLTATDMAVAAIAVEVGIPDPHHFNKVVRRELGASPRAVRERG